MPSLVGKGVKFAMLAGSMAAEAVAAYLRGEISLRELGRRYLFRLKDLLQEA